MYMYNVMWSRRMFTFGDYQPEQQDELLQTLNRKIGEVYRSCIEDVSAGSGGSGPSSAIGGARSGGAGGRRAAPSGGDSNLSTLQMLTAIEHRLEELCDQIEALPRERVAEAERSKEKERRFKVRRTTLFSLLSLINTVLYTSHSDLRSRLSRSRSLEATFV